MSFVSGYYGGMNKHLSTLLACLVAFLGCSSQTKINPKDSSTPPLFLVGRFVDDYGITYTISEKEWLMEPNQRFEILEWNTMGQYALAKNHPHNRSDPNLYTRIDFMVFDDEMSPFSWGYCYSTFDADSISKARAVAIADRDNPKTGCNGYPFSRLKKLDDGG